MKSIINKITAALLPLILVFGLAACSDVKTADKAVLTSFYPVYLIAERLVEGTDISLMNMARPQTGCLHDYQLTSLDMRLLSKSKAVIINGAGMEHSFIERAVENTGIKVIDSSDGLFGTEGEAVGHEEAFHSHDGHDHELNSHIWMSLKMAKAQAENICAGLIGLYPQYKKELESNKELFLADIASLEKLEDSENEGGEFNVISFNEAFHYLLEENASGARVKNRWWTFFIS